PAGRGESEGPMPVIEYRDFVIVADEVQTGSDGAVESFAVSVFDSPVGQARGKERVEMPPRLPSEARALGDQLLDFDVQRQIGLGRLLADLLLPPVTRNLFRRSVDCLRDGQGLRLRLRLAPELAALPWEYLWVPDARDLPAGPQFFLALQPRISIVR